MSSFADVFEVLLPQRMLRCRSCRYAVLPSHVKTHLANKHRVIEATIRRGIVEALDLHRDELAQTAEDVIYPSPLDPVIKGFPIWYDGLKCEWQAEDGTSCKYVCRGSWTMKQHARDRHGWVNAQTKGGDKRLQDKHSANKIWRTNVTCQQYFQVSPNHHYYEVAAMEPEQDEEVEEEDASYDGFFVAQHADIRQSQIDAATLAATVEGFDAHHSATVPWLVDTAIVGHIQGLRKEDIRSAIALPEVDDAGTLGHLARCLDNVLRRAYNWARGENGDSRMTWACATTLGRFQASKFEGSGKLKFFRVAKQPPTLERYYDTAKKLVGFLYRVAFGDGHFEVPDGTSRPEAVIQVGADIEAEWETLITFAAGDNDRHTEEQLIDMLMALIRQRTGSYPYHSPLLSFCAMHSVEAGSGAWRHAGDFNSHLSAITWIVQLIVFYYGARDDHDGNGATLATVQEICQDCLHQGVEGPMGAILRWRLMLFQVARDTVRDHQAHWDPDEKVLTVDDTELRLDQVPLMLQSEYIACQRLLQEDLMFGHPFTPATRADVLKDNGSVNQPGWNFTQARDNIALMTGRETALLSRIEQSPDLRRLYVEKRDDASARWRDNARASYESTVQTFLKHLCVLIFVSSGQPLREPEFFSITWQNTQRRRAIIIKHNRVMVHTQYHKMQQLTGRHRDNIRFLPPQIGEMLLAYIVYVQPLRLLFLRAQQPQAVLSPYLWERNNQIWTEGTISRCLQAACLQAGIPRLHLSNWRHITVAIVKTKFATAIDLFEADNEDADSDEVDDDVRIMTRQRNHTTRTVNMAYANQLGATFGNVYDGLLRSNLRASELWQTFWGTEIIWRDPKRKRVDDGESRLAQRIAIGIYRPRKPWTGDALLAGLRTLYNDQELEWKSGSQQQALETIMAWKSEVVVVLPTGGGKSLLFMLPPRLPDAGITILVVPLVALRIDLKRRCQELQLNYVEWSPGEAREAALVLVTLEAAATDGFMCYAQGLLQQQKLDRIVIDECHLTVTAASYRPAVEACARLRNLRTQFVYLTATLPPSMWEEFKASNCLMEPSLIRAPGNRANIHYTIMRMPSKYPSMLRYAAENAKKFVDVKLLPKGRHGLVLLYVAYRDDAKKLAELLCCDAYTGGDSLTVEEKQRILEDWVKPDTTPFLVATTALAEGFDCPHVRGVFNVGEPDSLVTFAQQVGRAGRDDAKAYSVILIPNGWKFTEPSGENPPAPNRSLDATQVKRLEREAVRDYIRGNRCRRMILSDYLDPAAFRHWCTSTDAGCDVCSTRLPNTRPAVPPPKSMDSEPTRLATPPPESTNRPSTTQPMTTTPRMASPTPTVIRQSTTQPITTTPRIASQTPTVIRTEADIASSNTPTPYQRRERPKEHVVQEYWQLLDALLGSCLFCRTRDRPWDHAIQSCPDYPEVRELKTYVMQRAAQRSKPWLQKYTACFRCLQPQLICPVRRKGDRGPDCKYHDMVWTTCIGIFQSSSAAQWLDQQFHRHFPTMETYTDWLGEKTKLGSADAIQAVRVAEKYFKLLPPVP